MMDMDRYYKELEEKQKKDAEEGKSTPQGSIPTHCPMCSRRCELTAPMCGRGMMFARENGL